MEAAVVTAHCPVCGQEGVGVVEHGAYATILHRFHTPCVHSQDVDLALSEIAISAPAPSDEPRFGRPSLPRGHRRW